MKYKWKLKNSDSNITVQEGDVEAKTQEEAMKKLNDKGINPHTAEVLEIISPMDITEGGDATVLT